MKYFKLLPALLMVIIAALPVAGIETYKIIIVNTKGVPVPLQVELADTEPLRMKGLMGRKTMREDRGMLFVFDREQKMNFWMKNTYIPLSIAYINKIGVINEIRDMKPLDTSVTYPSAMPALYALEVNQGWFARNNITKGCRIVLDGCVSK
ncbi:MAG TPA: DUF192 domain-containing protein [Spirochaetota bacterium]|jgi:uncharacterized membrane protein (UPF0127 family)|nr:DUF192 domain-containing protein [Spirochaetota bacterium]HPV40619.1 DUF192 domain-containing protein [Spirochaetota bacterium]